MRFRALLLPLYAVATLFPRLLSLPGLPPEVQLTELIFPVALWCFRRDLVAQIRRFSWFSVAAGLYVTTNLLSALWAGDAGAVIEAGARLYLVLLVFTVLAHDHYYGNRSIRVYWRHATLLVALALIIAYGLIVFAGMPDPFYLVSYFADYPYLGSGYRLRGTANVYGMLYMLLLPGLLFAYADWRLRGGPWWPVAVILLAGVLTLGKENLLFPIAVLLLEATLVGRERLAPLLRLMAAALALLLLLATHLLVVRNDSRLLDTAFTSGESLFEIGTYTIVETNYTTNKRAALLVGARYPLLGVGPGRYADYTANLVAEGSYPVHYDRFDPHSAWTGAFAETGLLGLLGLLALVSALYFYPGRGGAVVTILLALFLLTSVFKDVMNFRGLWVIVGLYLCPRGSIEPER